MIIIQNDLKWFSPHFPHMAAQHLAQPHLPNTNGINRPGSLQFLSKKSHLSTSVFPPAPWCQAQKKETLLILWQKRAQKRLNGVDDGRIYIYNHTYIYIYTHNCYIYIYMYDFIYNYCIYIYTLYIYIVKKLRPHYPHMYSIGSLL